MPQNQMGYNSADLEFGNENRSRFSSPMQISSGVPSREPSVEIIGAWPGSGESSLTKNDKPPSRAQSPASVVEIAPKAPSRPWESTTESSSPSSSRKEVIKSTHGKSSGFNRRFSPDTMQFMNKLHIIIDSSGSSDPMSPVQPVTTNKQVATEDAAMSEPESLPSLTSKLQDFVQSEMVKVKDRIEELKESIKPFAEGQAAKASVGDAAAPLIERESVVGQQQQAAVQNEELHVIREEMLRFSSIMEQILAKVEPLQPGYGEQAVQADSSSTTIPPEAASSKKRKRDDDDAEIEGPVVVIEKLMRPQKRSRTTSIARSVASAAGYTSLGAVATFAALAYCL